MTKTPCQTKRQGFLEGVIGTLKVLPKAEAEAVAELHQDIAKRVGGDLRHEVVQLLDVVTVVVRRIHALRLVIDTDHASIAVGVAVGIRIGTEIGIEIEIDGIGAVVEDIVQVEDARTVVLPVDQSLHRWAKISHQSQDLLRCLHRLHL
jgi:hypothetical protein